MAEGSARTKLATVALVIVGFALGFAEFIVIGITPDIAEEYGISLASAGNLVGFFAISYAVSTPIIVLSTGRFRRFPLFVTSLRYSTQATFWPSWLLRTKRCWLPVCLPQWFRACCCLR